MRTATALHIAGWILLVLGIIAGIVVMTTMEYTVGVSWMRSEPHPDRFIYGIAVIFGGIISALPLMGLGAILKTLIGIRDDLKMKNSESLSSSAKSLDNLGDNYKMKSLD